MKNGFWMDAQNLRWLLEALPVSVIKWPLLPMPPHLVVLAFRFYGYQPVPEVEPEKMGGDFLWRVTVPNSQPSASDGQTCQKRGSFSSFSPKRALMLVDPERRCQQVWKFERCEFL